MPSTPTISLHITTSSRTLDLSQPTPFTIRLNLNLHHANPITLNTRTSALFDGLTLHQSGLTFRSLSTNTYLPRPTRNITYESSTNDGTPSHDNADEFITLVPGEACVVEATIKPIAANQTSSSGAVEKVWKWPHVAGMKDGETYEVGVSEAAGVRGWMEGTLGELLEMRKAGRKPEVREEVIRYVVEEGARFEVRRPDEDGELDWP